MFNLEVSKQADDLFAAGGEAGEVMRSVSWEQTALGPVSTWSSALRTMVGVLLHNHSGMLLWWGPSFVQLYNNAYRPVLGDKHPCGMGQPVNECWSEIWHILKPMIEAPFQGKPATTSDDLLLIINRRGFWEETHFALAYSPVPDASVPSGIGGVLATVAETTQQVFAERQLKTLRELSLRAAEAKMASDACCAAAAILAQDNWDISFALFYLMDNDQHTARRVAESGFQDHDKAAAPDTIDLTGVEPLTWPLTHALQSLEPHILNDLTASFSGLPTGRWDQSPKQAVILTLRAPDENQVIGFLILGVSPHRRLDANYLAFFELVSSHVLIAIRNARAFDVQRQRLEQLAALDKAKTAFFSNISHEFRTPLTLMLGPLEDSLAETDEPLTPRQHERIVLIHRNGQRLLRLVNTLLDFSRIEAGRVCATFESIDLGQLTTDLASTFRSAIERAGMQLLVDCPALPQPVYVDVQMWEKIILNLLSNAFKHTFAGTISVRLKQVGEQIELRVSDSGIGIAGDQIPRLFERFHRVQDAKSRTHEGSGIGLALVQELLKIHKGNICVESAPDRGSTFIVTIPMGMHHLPAEQVGGRKAPSVTPLRTNAFVEEALRWLPVKECSEAAAHVVSTAGGDSARPSTQKIILADDNADMRDYVQRLLQQRWQVEAVPDGALALAAARANPPDLIISDVMMPQLDGLGLLRCLRTDPNLKHVPVILLSARAGEEAGIEGLEAGADDYLTKPFSAQELLARVAAQLQTKRIREEATRDLRHTIDRLSLAQVAGSMGIWEYDHVAQRGILSPECADLFGYPRDMPHDEILRESFRRIHPDDVQTVKERLAEVVATDRPISWEYRFRHPTIGERWLMSRASRMLAPGNATPTVIGVTVDISERKQAELALRESEERLRHALIAGDIGTWRVDLTTNHDTRDAGMNRILGLKAVDSTQSIDDFASRLHPDDRGPFTEVVTSALAGTQPYELDYRVVRPDGSIRWIRDRGVVIRDGHGKPMMITGAAADITELKQVEAALALRADELGRANVELEHFASIASHDLQEPLRMISSYSDILLKRYAPLFDAKAAEYFSRITDGALRMRSLIHALLAYSQVDKQPPVLALVPAREALADAMEHLQAEVRGKQGEVTIDDLPIVRGDRIRLTQLFQNLVANALKFTAQNRRPLIRITSNDAGEQYVFRVSDNGIGITPAGQERLFRIFSRLNTADAYPGSGIGLATCKKVVEQHGGRIWVESEPGVGSTFCFTIPKRGGEVA